MNEIVVKIGEKELKIKQNFRALMLFEDLAKKKISEIQESVGDIMLLFYCTVKANNKDLNINYDEFIDLIDDNAESFEIYTNYLKTQVNEVENTDKKKIKKK